MRHLFHVAAALALILSAAPSEAAEGEPVSVMDLAVAGPLGDKSLGNPGAPVTVVEYASMTCSHCATFHNETFAAFKEKYIDTGKVRFILREFPLDPLASAAFMLARCAPDDQYFPLVGLMFEQQENWAFVDDPGTALLDLLETKGFDEEKFKTCITDHKLFEHVTFVHDRADQKFGISGTPTFFFNGKREVGEITIDEVDRILAPML
ncbi:MAG: DsbA family protein [Bauldia sp.]|nr:MAG: DsbA family protein [Bauldia sp.]